MLRTWLLVLILLGTSTAFAQAFPELNAALARAQSRMRVGDYNGARQALAAARPLATELNRRLRVANLEAALAIYQGDEAHADAPFLALLPEAQSAPDPSIEFWLHNCLTWVRWSAHDFAGALAEAEHQRAVLERGALPAKDRERLLLHALWDRAYLLAEEATRSGHPDEEAWRRALDARASYESLARQYDDRDGMAVLGAFFEFRAGHGEAARGLATQVDDAHDSDVQDLYILALAFEAGGDRARAQAMRDRIAQSENIYLMLPIIARALAVSHPPVPPPPSPTPPPSDGWNRHFVLGAVGGVGNGFASRSAVAGVGPTLGYYVERNQAGLGIAASLLGGPEGFAGFASFYAQVFPWWVGAPISPYLGGGLGLTAAVRTDAGPFAICPGPCGPNGAGVLVEGRFGVELFRDRAWPRLDLGGELLLPAYTDTNGSYPIGLVADVRLLL